MKRIGLVVLIVALLALPGLAEVKRITDVSGVKYDTIFNADSTGLKVGMDKYQIVNANHNQKYNKLLASFYFAAPTAVSTNAQLGDVDSGIVWLRTGSPYWEHTLWGDSAATLADTFNFVYTGDMWVHGAEIGYEADDTLMALWKPQDTAFEALNLDYIWFEYHVSDTSGSGDTIALEIHYWLRLIEEY